MLSQSCVESVFCEPVLRWVRVVLSQCCGEPVLR